MTSLLAFAWRKINETSRPVIDNEYDLTPAVSKSSSGETLTKQASDDPLLDAPPTPEGFRPRKSVEDIRNELDIPFNRSLRWESSLDILPSLISSDLVPSPQPSNYSGSHSARRIAKSPDLGQAKTAVGALVAMAETRVTTDETTNKPKATISSILPPREWLEVSEYNIELPYKPLNDSFPSPSKKQEHQIHGISDDESCMYASPSSITRRKALEAQTGQKGTSFTRCLLNTEKKSNTKVYDFQPVGDENTSLSDAKASAMDVSGISLSKDIESVHSLVDELGEDEKQVEGGTCYERMKSGEFREAFCPTESQIKEDLLLSTLERLQDNTDLVELLRGELSSLDEKQTTLTHFGEGSIFQGFSRDTRVAICGRIDTTIRDFPLHISAYAEGQADVKKALSFCRSLVENAIPTAEKPGTLQLSAAGIPEPGHRWRCIRGFRASLGFDETPQSPEPMGGADTSLFSLPSESANDTTPHTSNVSLTTTITSSFSPERNKIGYFSERGSVRLAMERVTELFSILDSIFVELLNGITTSKDTIRVAEGMKQIYIDLMKLSVESLKGLIDSFELEFLTMKTARVVSIDNDAHAQHQTLATQKCMAKSAQHVSQTMGISMDSLQMDILKDEEKAANLFSPSTEDMKSIEQSTTTFEDLGCTADNFQFQSLVPQNHMTKSQQHVSQTMRTSKDSLQMNVVKDEEKAANLFSPSTEDMKSIEQSTTTVEDLQRTADSFQSQSLDSKNKLAKSQQHVSKAMGTSMDSLEINVVKDEEKATDLFSPSTEAMKSIEQSNMRVDDLRRAVGSFDMEEVVEDREGPPTVESRKKKHKNKRGIWKRRRFRKKTSE